MASKMNLFINCARTYTRWVSRRPAKILDQKHAKAFEQLGKVELEEYTQMLKPETNLKQEQNKVQTMNEFNDDHVTEIKLEDLKISQKSTKFTNVDNNGTLKVKDKSKKQELKKPKLKENYILTDEKTNFEFEKLKMGDPKFSTIMLSVKSRKTRQQTNQILLEGRRLIRDALLAKMTLQTLMFSKVEHLTYLSEWLKLYERDANCMFYKVPHGDMSLWSDLTTNPGIMALFSRPPQYYIPENSDSVVPITVICDNVREPSNLGAIIRTCAAIPCHQLILMKGCVDPWDTKVLRAGAGGHFRLTLIDDIVWNNIKEQLPSECQVFIADANTHRAKVNLPIANYDKVNFKNADSTNEKHSVIVIGGETEGISLDAYQFANYFNGQRLHIPIAQGVDSLNTATALSVLAFEMRRQLLN